MSEFIAPDGYDAAHGANDFAPPDGYETKQSSTWDKVKGPALDAVSIEKHPGLPRTPVEALKQLAGGVMRGVTSPLPTGALTMIPEMMSQAAGQVGPDVARAAQPTLGTIPARLLGMGASVALDPMTYAGAGTGAKAAESVAKQVLHDAAPAIMRVFTNTPEAATRLGLASEDALKAFKGTTPEIEGAVVKLQNAIKETRASVGKRIGDARESLGFAKDLETRASEMAQGMSNLYPTKEAVAQGFLDLQKQLPTLAEKDALAKLYELRISADALQKSSAFGPTATTSAESGTLKAIAGDINKAIEVYPKGKILRKLDNAYSQAMTTYESLQGLLKDAGKGEDMLRRIFTSDKGVDREIRKRLATVEAVTGRPVMQDLFKQFASQALKKGVGRPAVAAAGSMAMATSAGTALAHPLAGAAQLAGGAALIAGQSPRVMIGAMRAAPKLAQIPGAVAGAGAGATASSAAPAPTNRSQQLLNLLRQKAQGY